MPPETEVQLGQHVEDQISGFTGYVTTIGDHLSGCTRFGVTSDSGTPDEEFFYENQLEVDTEETEFTDAGERAMEDESDVSVGNRVEDEVSGFEGIATVINYKLWNCPQVLIYSDTGCDGEEPATFWTDAPQVNQVEGSSHEDLADEIESDVVEDTGSVVDSRNENLSR
jgi:hypothetical protein